MSKISKCPVCRKAWHKHDGIIHTCRKLETARAALKVLAVWAEMTRHPTQLEPLDQTQVEELCTKALEETK